MARATPAGQSPQQSHQQEAALPKLYLGVIPVSSYVRHIFYTAAFLTMILLAALVAYGIRTIAQDEFGNVLHHGRPWFNYRATQYLEEHGWTAFFRWFDYMSWYPLGRPVGTTIYPGLQITAVGLHRLLNHHLGVHMSLNDVCVLIPAWFGAVATLLLALLTFEAAGSLAAAAAAAMTFAVVPAHTMRSMAGEFDNECIAVTAMLLTFYCWVRSLRGPRSWPVGALAGLAYGYMVAAWGGYIFVLNMVALHAAVTALLDWARNTYSPALLKAYSLFFVIGTAIATRVPPVGLSPFKSLEQLAALLVFVFLWGLQVAEWRRAKLGYALHSSKNLLLRAQVLLSLGVPAVAGFAAWSGRSRTDRYAEAAATPPAINTAEAEVLWQCLHILYFLWLFGMSPLLVSAILSYTNAKGFVVLGGAVGIYGALTRVPHMTLLAVPACVVSGIVLGWTLDAAGGAAFWTPENLGDTSSDDDEEQGSTAHTSSSRRASPKQQASRAPVATTAATHTPSTSSADDMLPEVAVLLRTQWIALQTAHPLRALVLLWLAAMVLLFSFNLTGFGENAVFSAAEAAEPGVMYSNWTSEGEPILVKDYYDSYRWLAQHTPPDARVLAWWDYGYQITGIANRTTLADGNTWNHEHIATIGKMLTSPVVEAHSLVRHMADYVLISSGGAISDLRRAAAIAQAANTIYRDTCPSDPKCTRFTTTASGPRKKQGAALKRSLLYHLHESEKVDGVSVDPRLFREVHSSVNGLVRIFQVMNVSQKSKAWVADPANRVCDAPGSWICPGQYPPAKPIQDMLAKRVDLH